MVVRGSASLMFVTYVTDVIYVGRLKTLEIVTFFRTYQYIHLLNIGISISSTKQTSSFEEEKIVFKNVFQQMSSSFKPEIEL